MNDAMPLAHLPLHHPWGDATPAHGTWMPLRSGVHWVRMPLPFALNHINLWVLDDTCEGPEGQPGWAVVDAGVATDTVREAWQQLWQGPMQHRPLARMVVTHMHPDHVGNAQWLIDRYSAPGRAARLWMGAAEHMAALLASQSTTGFGGEHAAQFFESHGLRSPEDIAKVRARRNYYSDMVPEVPRQYRRLMDGMQVQIGSRRWQALAGHGHSPEHMALFDPEDALLISGDMLLPRISTNVSVQDMEPEGDALGLFLASLERMNDLPRDTLALPSHGLPFTGIHARIAQLKQHHRERLDDVLAACTEQPACAAEMLPVLFKRPLDLHQTTFAMGEAVAHLNHLWHLGEIKRHQDASGVWRFSRG